ncbi:MAG: DHA2 family efflux MFS transporter permease subunit [Proteobacteria bacterium]|nr:DHA2 family efflux MFS transporter permease subunit [Pseudomonadota bacterium]
MRTLSLIVASAMFMEQLDGTVLATALPAMAQSFGTEPLRMNVALTSYLLSLAVFIPVSGTVADRLGARTVFRGAIFFFTLGSILCGLSNSLAMLIGARIVQGAGGAMMVPVGRLTLLRTATKAELVAAMVFLMIPATTGPILGPPLGGFLVTYLNWRWIFYINVPVGIAGLIAATLFIEDLRFPAQARFDTLGFILSGVALASLVFGIELASRGVGQISSTAALFAVGLAAAILYFRHSRGHAEPILDFALMRVPTFGISVLAGAFSRIAVGAQPFLLPMMLQLGFGMTAAQSGSTTLAMALGSLVMRPCARVVLRRLGFRWTMIWVGTLATLLLALCAALRPSWPYAAVFAVLFLGGFFQSLQFMAYNTVCYADIPRLRMSRATSFYTTFQQICLSLGIATAAASLAASTALSGHASPALSDFSFAFLVVAAIAMLAPVVSARLAPDAGAELIGKSLRSTAGRRDG